VGWDTFGYRKAKNRYNEEAVGNRWLNESQGSLKGHLPAMGRGEGSSYYERSKKVARARPEEKGDPWNGEPILENFLGSEEYSGKETRL